MVKAKGIKVAFLAFAPYNYDANLLDRSAARVLIKRAVREANIVVVYMHAGAEGPDANHVTGHEEYYLGEDRGNAEAFAHMAIDLGAERRATARSVSMECHWAGVSESAIKIVACRSRC
jgi:hypothetical protein